MNSSTEPSTLFSRVMRLIALPSLLILLPNYLALAAVNCDAGFVSDNFSVADYTKLAPIASPPSPRINQVIDGNDTESYLVGSNNLTLNGALTPNSTNIYQSTAIASTQVFQLAQDFADRNSSRTVSYTFKNKFTDQAQPLNKLSLSIYDIDSSIVGFDSQGTRYFSWFDQVTINGFTSTGALVSPIVESKGAGITSTAPYRQNTVASSVICNGLDDNCKLSVTFTDLVVRVDVVYGNNPALSYSTNNITNNNPASQVVHIRFDGYCYQPQPRLTYKKELSAPRKVNTDEFVVQIKDNADGSVVTNGIATTTTAGEGSTITNGTGTTGTFKVNPTKTYTLTEAIAGTTNLVNYAESYLCKKSDGTTVTALDPKNLKMTYGDNWTCTITNGRPNYTFTGFVFNDNGGIPASDNTKFDVSPTFTNNQNYFNGIFDSNESGIGSSGLQVRLTSCGPNGGTNITGTTAQNISQTSSSVGQYKFIVPASVIAALSPQKVCIVQVEPNTWDYAVDTTANNREVTLTSSVYDYKNLDFGEVQANNASLVLIKSQYVHSCNINASYNNSSGTPSQTPLFITTEIKDIEPGKCIAYKIEAYNRGHVDLKDIQITDILQITPIKSVFFSPSPLGDPITINNNVNILPVDKIISNKFDLLKPVGSSLTKATLYFNTKYGTTLNAQ